MIFAHSGISDAAERQIVNRRLRRAVVNVSCRRAKPPLLQVTDPSFDTPFNTLLSLIHLLEDLGLGTTGQVLLDQFKQLQAAHRFRKNSVSKKTVRRRRARV